MKNPFKRQPHVRVPLSKDELAFATMLAKEAGRPLGDWFREMVFSSVDPEKREQFLSKIDAKIALASAIGEHGFQVGAAGNKWKRDKKPKDGSCSWLERVDIRNHNPQETPGVCHAPNNLGHLCYISLGEHRLCPMLMRLSDDLKSPGFPRQSS